MARVFISYKRADKEKVFRLKEKIEAATGESCWIDLEGIESDTQFVKVIMQAIEDAEIFLFMHSKEHSDIEDYELDWTIREISYAQDLRKRIVFVNIDKTPLTKWFKFMFPHKQQIDATSEESFGKLLEDMKGWLKDEDEPEAVEDEAYTEGLAYEFYGNDKTSTAIVLGIGKARDEKVINIPPVVDLDGRKYSVILIAGDAFKHCNNINSVTIPDSVTAIRGYAFWGCSSLTSISIPKSVQEIGWGVFKGCSSLTSISIPKSVQEIGWGVFKGCSSLTSVTIPDSVTEIEPEAFMGCVSLTSVTIPDSVKVIGRNAFEGCPSLESVEISRNTEVDEDAFPWNCKVNRR